MKKVKEICPTLTKQAIEEGALLVDVREKDEVDLLSFDVPNIVNIPLSEFEERYIELTKDQMIVMVCKVGERSLKTAYYLANHGYTDVSNMDGGIEKWVKKGFPTKGDISSLKKTDSGCCGSSNEVKSNDSGCCGSSTDKISKNENSCCGSDSNKNIGSNSCC